MIIADTPEKIDLYRMLVLRSLLKLEIKGIKMSKGRTAYATIKTEYNIGGNRERVLAFISDVIDAAQQPIKGEA